MEKLRLKRIESLLQKELAEIFRRYAKENNMNTLVSVSKVNISPDLSIARCYLSIFPSAGSQNVYKLIKQNTAEFRGQLGNIVRHQLRVIPSLEFFIDDSLDYIETIEKELRGEGENPIKK